MQRIFYRKIFYASRIKNKGHSSDYSVVLNEAKQTYNTYISIPYCILKLGMMGHQFLMHVGWAAVWGHVLSVVPYFLNYRGYNFYLSTCLMLLSLTEPWVAKKQPTLLQLYNPNPTTLVVDFTIVSE